MRFMETSSSVDGDHHMTSADGPTIPRMKRGVAVLAVVGALLATAPAAASPAGWWARQKAAVQYVESRQGDVSFAYVGYRGRLHGYRPWRVAPSASLLKAMLLVAYLNKPSVRGRTLTAEERGLLGPMIRRSDNTAAGIVLGRVGERRLNMLARRADMIHFRLRSPWGLSEVTAGDQARFFFRIDRYVTSRHRYYARVLLSTIVPSQRWGIPPVVPSGWKIFFKGGWGSGTGRVTHQSALLEDGGDRLALSVLTEWNPSHAYGTWTIRGIAARLLETPLPRQP
jgi:beta-lactamase class A